MADCKAKDCCKKEENNELIEEANNDSEAESLDSEGYSKHDPYAA